SGIGAFDDGRDQRLLPRKLQGYFDDLPDVLWREPQLAPGLMQLVHELADLLLQVALELQQSANRLGILFCFVRVKAPAITEHRLFGLSSDDRAYLAEVFPNRLDLAHCTH